MSDNNSNSGITKTFGKVYVESVQDGVSTKHNIAIIRQEVETTYPASQSGTDKSVALFGGAAFGEGQTFKGKPRSYLAKVPLDATVASVTTEMDKLEEPRIYRELSNDVKDVMHANQILMVENGKSGLSFENYEEKLIIRHPETKAIILDNFGQKQYGQNHLSPVPVDDVDYRKSPVRVSINEDAVTEEISTPAMDLVGQPEM